MQIRAVPINEHVVAGLKKTSLLVLYEIRANSDQENRLPFDLAVVLDKSG
jgi:hypothetical protein